MKRGGIKPVEDYRNGVMHQLLLSIKVPIKNGKEIIKKI